MDRITALRHWLHSQLADDFTLSEPIGDASSRRYYRVSLSDGTTRMAMDAPPDLVNSAPFVAIAQLFSSQVPVPRILATDMTQGFLLIDDLGEIDLQTALSRTDESGAENLYRSALRALLALQATPCDGALPDYSAAQMVDDLNRFSEWYADKHLGKPLQGDDLAVWERSRSLLVMRALSQTKVPIHFDFHSRNLIVAEPMGVIDFQDARIGPITYDLVSLLKDMYVQWPEDFRLDLCIRYWDAARKLGLAVPESFDDFFADFEWMGVFRHIRTLGTFARLAHRDGKPRYIEDMPVALGYLRETCARYVELHPLFKLLNRLNDVPVTVGYTF